MDARGPGIAAGHPSGIPTIPDICASVRHGYLLWALLLELLLYFLLTWLPFYLVRSGTFP